MLERNMKKVVVEIPGEVILGLKVPSDQAGDAVRMAAAVKLFEIGQLSSGAAARLAGVSRLVFLSRLSDYGVDTFRLTKEQIEKETRLA
jgi:predicted HTH domain antitoxin